MAGVILLGAVACGARGWLLDAYAVAADIGF